VDPLAREFPHVTPYNFVENNPVMMVDPTGLAAIDYFDLDGNKIGSDGNDDDKRNFVITNSTEVQAVKNAETSGAHMSLSSLSSAKVSPSKKSIGDGVYNLEKTITAKGLQEHSSATMLDNTTFQGGYGPQITVDYKKGTIEGESDTPPICCGYDDSDIASINHSHPTAVLTSPITGVQFMAGNALLPSPTDQAGVMNFLGFNIISGPLGPGKPSNGFTNFQAPPNGLAIYRFGSLSHIFTLSAAKNYISNARW
jgi:hypothetical protein